MKASRSLDDWDRFFLNGWLIVMAAIVIREILHMRNLKSGRYTSSHLIYAVRIFFMSISRCCDFTGCIVCLHNKNVTVKKYFYIWVVNNISALWTASIHSIWGFVVTVFSPLTRKYTQQMILLIFIILELSMKWVQI